MEPLGRLVSAPGPNRQWQELKDQILEHFELNTFCTGSKAYPKTQNPVFVGLLIVISLYRSLYIKIFGRLGKH